MDTEFKDTKTASDCNETPWVCNHCNFINNCNNSFKCAKCNLFITSLNVVRNNLKNIIINYNEKNNNNDYFLHILKLFKSEKFIKYNSKTKLEELLLFIIILSIQNNATNIIKMLANNKVACFFLFPCFR